MANYEIVKKIAVLGGKPDGVTKEINIVKWGVYDPMIDIRRWQGDIASKGISLKQEEAQKLLEALKIVLGEAEQRVLLNAMELNDCTPSHAQAIRLKKLSQEGVLQDQTIYDILAEQKPNQQEQYKFKREDIRKYFPKNYTDKQICDMVIKLLEQWQRRRERDRDSR